LACADHGSILCIARITLRRRPLPDTAQWECLSGSACPQRPAATLRRRPSPFAGRCVIVGADRNGEDASARLSIAVLRRDVKWLGLIQPKVTFDPTVSGFVVTYSQVK